MVTPIETSFSERAKTFNKTPSEPNVNQESDGLVGSIKERMKILNIKNQEGIAGQRQREALGNLARVLETGAGWAGNTKSFIDNLIIGAYEHAPFTGVDVDKTYFGVLEGPSEVKHEGQKRREAPEGLIRALKGNPEMLGFNPPTSEELRETVTKPISEKLTGTKEYLEPQSGYEKTSQEAVSDLTNMFMPGSNGIGFLTRVASPLVGQAGKSVVKHFGASEGTQEMAKLGSMGLFSLSNMANGRNYAINMRDAAENMVGQGHTGSASPTLRMFRGIRHRLSQGDPAAAWKRPALHYMDVFENAVQNGRADIRNIIRMKEDLNRARRGLGAFEVPGPDHPEATRALEEVHRGINETLQEYSRTRNPRFWPAKQLADQAFAVTERSGAISRFIEKTIGKPFVSDAAKVLFGSALAGGGAMIPKAAAVGVPLFAISKTVQIANRIAQSPLLRRYYTDVVSAAALGHANATRSAMERLDKALAKEEKKGKK